MAKRAVTFLKRKTELFPTSRQLQTVTEEGSLNKGLLKNLIKFTGKHL